MLSEKQKSKYGSLRVEIINLNILAYSYIKKLNRIPVLFKTSTREHIHEEFIALRYMENGIILHLTNLDDDTSNFSFRKILKEINKTDVENKEIITKKLSLFRRSINALKVKYRNKRIAHLNYDEDLELDQFLNFNKILKPLISQANEIGDILWGEKIEYFFKLGSIEGVINFRDELERL